MDKDRLLKPRLGERTVALDGVGELRVRGLSRTETIRLKDFVGREDEGEVWMLALTVVDPPLTEDEVRVWRDNAGPGELEAVVETISELSGLGQKDRDAMARFPGGPGSPPRVHGGGPAEHDGDPAA